MVEAVAKTETEQILEPLPSQVIKARQDLTKVLQAKTGASGNASIYEHIIQVIDRIVQSCPDQAIERFEEISFLIKNSDEVNMEEFVRCHEDRRYAKHCGQTAEGTKAAIESLRKMFPASAGSAEAAGEGEEGGGGGGPVLGLVQDLTSLNRHVFNQAGVELGEYGSLILQKSL